MNEMIFLKFYGYDPMVTLNKDSPLLSRPVPFEAYQKEKNLRCVPRDRPLIGTLVSRASHLINYQIKFKLKATFPTRLMRIRDVSNGYRNKLTTY